MHLLNGTLLMTNCTPYAPYCRNDYVVYYNMAGFITVDSETDATAYMPIIGFTTTDIGCERGIVNDINKTTLTS